VGALYTELGLDGDVLDLMSSWISHFEHPPQRLVGLGMNAAELSANPTLAEYVIHDLNADPTLPFADASFDAATCCVSVDYLTSPIAVFREVARVLRPGGPFVVTFSNRCFPSKAIRGWLGTDDEMHVQIVNAYFALSGGFGPVRGGLRTPPGPGDPLYAVWASR
jgi:SAM-dependent methyltransferase